MCRPKVFPEQGAKSKSSNKSEALRRAVEMSPNTAIVFWEQLVEEFAHTKIKTTNTVRKTDAAIM